MYAVQGKYTVLEGTPLYPHKCSVCGFSNNVNSNRMFVDWNCEFDPEPAVMEHLGLDPRNIYHVYFCLNCAEELVSALDYVPRQRLNESQLRASEQFQYVLKCEERIKELENALRIVSGIRPGTPAFGPLTPELPQEFPGRSDSIDELLEDVGESNSEPEQNDPPTVESIANERPVQSRNFRAEPKVGDSKFAV